MLIPLSDDCTRSELRDAIGALEILARHGADGAADELQQARELMARLYPRDRSKRGAELRRKRANRKRAADSSEDSGRFVADCSGGLLDTHRGRLGVRPRLIRAEDRLYQCFVCDGTGGRGSVCVSCNGSGTLRGCAERDCEWNGSLRFDGPEDSGSVSPGGSRGIAQSHDSGRFVATMQGAAGEPKRGGLSALDRAAIRESRATRRLRRLRGNSPLGRRLLDKRDRSNLAPGGARRVDPMRLVRRSQRELGKRKRAEQRESERERYYGSRNPQACRSAAYRALRRLGVQIPAD